MTAKIVSVGIKALHFSVYDAIATYSKGNIPLFEVLQRLGIEPECSRTVCVCT
jgi:hypothetical protein